MGHFFFPWLLVHAIHHGSTVSDIILPAVCDCLCLCPADVAFAAFYHSPLCKPFGLECHPKIYPSNCWLLHLRLLHMFQVLMEWTPGCFISLPKLSTCSYVILKLSTSWFPPLCAHKSESIMSDPLKHKTIELHQDLCQGSFCLRQHECQDEGQHVGRMWKLLVGWLASSQARRFLSQTYLTGPVPIPIGRVLNVKWRSGCSLCEMALIWMRFFRVAMAKKYKMAVEMLVAIQCKKSQTSLVKSNTNIRGIFPFLGDGVWVLLLGTQFQKQFSPRSSYEICKNC